MFCQKRGDLHFEEFGAAWFIAECLPARNYESADQREFDRPQGQSHQRGASRIVRHDHPSGGHPFTVAEAGLPRKLDLAGNP
jgi:hypothetical protein